jgi:hypothetical protein
MVSTPPSKAPDTANLRFDEVRVLALPTTTTAGVNRLLGEEVGWRILDVRVAENATVNEGVKSSVVYVLGHLVAETEAGDR